MADLVGKALGKYQLVERLGRGGMADVYKGYHTRLERYVAVKTLHSHLIDTAPDFLPRFEREAKSIASLRHSHIVQVFDFDLQGDIYYMVMELVDGGSLGDELHRLAGSGQYMPFNRVVQLMQEIGSALDYAHQNSMLHRDIKPSNVLLDRDGHAYLADFGIARILGSGTHFTTTGTLIGTPHYMSPEQGRGEELTTASDVYALAVMLFEMLVGRVPYDAETPYGIIHKHIHEPLPAAHLLRSDLLEEVEAVLNKALAKDPQDRYQSAGELADAFQQALSTRPAAYAPVAAPETSVLPPEHLEPQVDLPVVSTPASAVQVPSPAGSEKTSAHSAVKETPAAGPAPAAPIQSPAGGPAPVSRPPAVQVPEARKVQKKKSSRLWLLLVLAAVLVLAFIGYLAIGYVQQQQLTQGCNSPESCFDQANQFIQEGKPGLSLPALNQGIDLVPPDKHPPYARLVCRRGDVNLMLERKDLAARDFILCIEWTEQDRDLEDLRAYAREMLQQLK